MAAWELKRIVIVRKAKKKVSLQGANMGHPKLGRVGAVALGLAVFCLSVALTTAIYIIYFVRLD